jgi:hypothetical protein
MLNPWLYGHDTASAEIAHFRREAFMEATNWVAGILSHADQLEGLEPDHGPEAAAGICFLNGLSWETPLLLKAGPCTALIHRQRWPGHHTRSGRAPGLARRS